MTSRNVITSIPEACLKYKLVQFNGTLYQRNIWFKTQIQSRTVSPICGAMYF